MFLQLRSTRSGPQSYVGLSVRTANGEMSCVKAQWCITWYMTSLVKKQHPTARTQPSACVCVSDVKRQWNLNAKLSSVLRDCIGRNIVVASVFWPCHHVNALCPEPPPPTHNSSPPCSAVAMATHQEAPSCVWACDRNFITAHKRWLCVLMCLCAFCLNLAFDHVPSAARCVCRARRESHGGIIETAALSYVRDSIEYQ